MSQQGRDHQLNNIVNYCQPIDFKGCNLHAKATTKFLQK
jgi:hypothetical protein